MEAKALSATAQPGYKGEPAFNVTASDGPQHHL
jgi:hypothetical protein